MEMHFFITTTGNVHVTSLGITPDNNTIFGFGYDSLNSLKLKYSNTDRNKSTRQVLMSCFNLTSAKQISFPLEFSRFSI